MLRSLGCAWFVALAVAACGGGGGNGVALPVGTSPVTGEVTPPSGTEPAAPATPGEPATPSTPAVPHNPDGTVPGDVPPPPPAGSGDDGTGNEAPPDTSVPPPLDLPPSQPPVVPPVDPVEQAMLSGNASKLTAADRPALARKALAVTQARDETLSALLTGVSAEYDPTQWSQLLVAATQRVQPYLVGDKGNTLAAVGRIGDARIAAYAGNTLEGFRNTHLDAHAPAFRRLLAWLVQDEAGAALPSPIKLAIAGLDAAQTPNDFAAAGVTAQVSSCDALAAGCAAGADLVVISSSVADSATLASQVAAVLDAGKPMLYIHHNTWGQSAAGNKVLAAMDLAMVGGAGNFYQQDKIAPNRPVPGKSTLTAFLERTVAGDAVMGLDWNKCTLSTGKMTCDAGVPRLQEELLGPLEQLRTLVDTFNRAGRDPFKTDNTELLRSMLLMADVLRAQIDYPLDKAANDPLPFQNAMLADNLVAYAREFNAAQPDLGSFRDAAAALPAAGPDETVDVRLKAASGFTAIGRFALPAQPFTVELIDGGTAKVLVMMNTQSTGSTRLWNTNSYDRPRYLRSPTIALEKGVPLQLSTPYGGTLQLAFSEATAGQTVRLRLKGVGRHPFFDSAAADADQTAFMAQLADTPLGWAEIKSGQIEIHSRADMMLEAIQNEPYYGNVTMMLDETQKYLDVAPYTLAGYAGYTLPASVAASCSTLQWDCTDPKLHPRPPPQHFNIDRYAQCGGACSGNPIDETWPFMPRGWGESHELGHNNQPGLLRVYEGKSSEVSNNIFALHKTWRLRREAGVTLDDGRLNYKAAFDKLAAAKEPNAPATAAYDALWSDPGYGANGEERLVFYMQWVHYWAARHGNEAQGWDIITLLYLHQRQLSSKHAADNWATVKIPLGYGSYAARPADNGNDNLLIALSTITGRDQRATFNLWGIRYSAAAVAQMNALALTAEPAFFFANPNSTAYSQAQRVDMTVATPVYPTFTP